MVSYTDIYHPEKKSKAEYWFGEQFAKWVNLRFFKGLGRLLDIGCGKGVFLLGFKKLGYQVYGLDIDKRALELAKTKNLKVSKINLENQKFPFRKNFFDYVFLRYVISHVQNTKHLLDEIKRVLKPGGLVFILELNWETSHKTFYNDFTIKLPFTLRSLKGKLMQHGFKVMHGRCFRNVPYVWRYSLRAFDFTFPGHTSMLVIGKKQNPQI